METIGAPGSIRRLMSELPEPTTPLTRYDVATSTPWGTAQTATYYGKGIVAYSTASHGGFHVSAALNEQIPWYLRQADKYADGVMGWYEEDCGWAIVVVSFPERFSKQLREDAMSTMHSVYPAQWERFLTERKPE
jgi:uncharacterized protein DUF7007